MEKEEILFSPDSIPASSGQLKVVRPSRWSIALALGGNLSNMLTSPYNESQVPLNNYLGRAYKPLPGWSFQADVSGRFITLKGKAGTIEIASSVGVALQQARFEYSSIDNPEELNVDSVISYSSDNGELLLQYFTLTEPPDIGEVDSLYPQLSDSEFRLALRDVSAKLRATFYRSPKGIRFFAETGIIKRYVEMTLLSDDFYYISNSQLASAMNETRWRASDVLIPHFALGAEMTLSSEGVLDRNFWSIGTMLQITAPASTVLRSELFSMELKNVGISLFGRFHF